MSSTRLSGQDAVQRFGDHCANCGDTLHTMYGTVEDQRADWAVHKKTCTRAVVQTCSICEEVMTHAFKSTVDMRFEQFTQNVCDHSFCVGCTAQWVRVSLETSAKIVCAHEACNCLMMASDVKRLDAEAGTSLHERMHERMHAGHTTMHGAIADDSAAQKWVEENCAKCTRCGVYVEHGGGCDQMVCHCGEEFSFRAQRVEEAGLVARQKRAALDQWCWSRRADSGFDEDGYDEDGFDRSGFDEDGDFRDGGIYDDDGFNKRGFDEEGNFRDGGIYDDDGFNKDGFDEDGFDEDGFDEDECDEDGFYRW